MVSTIEDVLCNTKSKFLGITIETPKGGVLTVVGDNGKKKKKW